MTEPILSSITNIKVPGIATITYWSLFKTKEKLYFVQTGSAVGLGGGGLVLSVTSVVSDVLASRQNTQASSKDIASILAESEQYMALTKDQYSFIEIKKCLFGGAVVRVRSGKLKLKLSRKNYQKFLEIVQI